MARSTLYIRSFAFAAVTVGLVACVEGVDENVVILQNQAPDNGCVIPAAPGEAYLGSGLIDAESQLGYIFTPVAKNFANVEEGQQEQQKIAFVTSATVRIDVATPDDFNTSDDALLAFNVPFAARIEPGATTSMVFEIVPQDLLEELGAELPANDPSEHALLLVDVRLNGSMGGGTFHTAYFQYPVEVCRGCLSTNLGDCSTLPTTFSPANTGGACNPAQDDVVDCCQTGTNLVCPAEGTEAP